jgi:thiamine pyrophosphokinase
VVFLKRAVIFANGELGRAETVRALLRPDDLLIAADGGAHHCRRLGLTPHLVIGDLDSVTSEIRAALEETGAQLEIYPPWKDETDLELAIRAAQGAGATEVILLAALDGRWDQSLANVLLLAHLDFANLSLRLVHEQDTLWIVRDQTVVRGQPGDRVSLLPLAGNAQGVTLTGLEYPLHDSTLPFGATLGISNTLIAPEASISVRNGILLVIHSQKETDHG